MYLFASLIVVAVISAAAAAVCGLGRRFASKYSSRDEENVS